MWIMWGFAVFIPLGIVWAFVTGEISTGSRGHYTGMSLGEEPLRFLMVIGILCVVELFLVRTLLGIRHEESLKQGRKRPYRRTP